MKCLLSGSMFSVLVLLANVASAAVPEQARVSIDRFTGGKGTYVAEEGVYKLLFPREEATIVLDSERLSPNHGLNSWAAFSSAIHQTAMLTGEFILLDDEVNTVAKVALDGGLEVTGLVASSLFEGPRLHTLDVTGSGTFEDLAKAFRRGLDEIRRIRRARAGSSPARLAPQLPMESAMTPGPLDAVLSMKGTVIHGVYRAAIGRRAVMKGEMIGREMGMSTWVSFAGTNDRAIGQGEFIASPEELKTLLKGLLMKGVNIVSIRNHLLEEHPRYIFVRFWGQGTAIELATAVRYALDLQVGAVQAPSGSRI